MDDTLLAAVDLGSNSFRLSVARVLRDGGREQVHTIDRLKDAVQLAAGLTATNTLDAAVVERAIAVLQRYGERLKGFHPDRVRAVATNTFRVARDADAILQRAQTALGFPIEVISGQEEARLIYAGVVGELSKSDAHRLVMDIGGGSTEIILGKGHAPLHLASLALGCVTYTRHFFPDGRITAARFARARLAARRELEGIARIYRRTGWQQAYGSSGTAKGLLAILLEGGLSERGITLDGLLALQARLIQAGQVAVEHLPGIKPARAPVLAGGLAIMLAAFEELKIEMMLTGDGALRAGVLADLLGRRMEHDKREETVEWLLRRYDVDVQQAQRVRELALRLLKDLDLEREATDELARTLAWAASLHEIGLSITRSNYHLHSAYILAHADMPGFSNDDQAQLSWLAQGHQGKPNRLENGAGLFNKHFKPAQSHWLALLSLRLAVLLCRRRETLETLPLQLRRKANRVTIQADARWLQARALTAYSLRAEVKYWHKSGLHGVQAELIQSSPKCRR